MATVSCHHFPPTCFPLSFSCSSQHAFQETREPSQGRLIMARMDLTNVNSGDLVSGISCYSYININHTINHTVDCLKGIQSTAVRSCFRSSMTSSLHAMDYRTRRFHFVPVWIFAWQIPARISWLADANYFDLQMCLACSNQQQRKHLWTSRRSLCVCRIVRFLC